MHGLALLAIAVFARAATYTAGLPGTATAAIGATAIAIAGPVWLGPATDSLSTATWITGAICTLGTLMLWRVGPFETPEAPNAGPTPWILRLPIALAAVAVVWTTFGSHFWDEHSCHYSTASVIARGVFPPEHPLFPGEPFRYHFGYDVLAAHVRRLTDVPIDVALDAATLISYALLLAVCRDFGRRLAGRWGGGFMMLLVPLGGGMLAFLLFRDMGPLEVHWDALPARWANSTPPPVISNFFQHPQGLGMSFALAVIGVFASDDRHPVMRRRRALIGAFLLGVGAVVHIVFFAVLGVALGGGVVVQAISTRRVQAGVERIAALLLALGIGYSLGGFFAPGPAVAQVLRWGTSFFSGPWLAIVGQHLVLFGLPLLFLPIALVETARRRTPLLVPVAIAAVIGFIVPNIVTYARSWDIVKFLGVGMFFANVLFAVRLARWTQTGWATAAALATVLSTNTAVVWLLRVSVLDGKLGVPKIHFPGSNRAAHALGMAFDDVVPPRDRVLVADVNMARASGWLTPGFDWRRYGIGFMIDRPQAERWAAIKPKAQRTLDPSALGEMEIRWVLIGPHERAGLTPAARTRLADPALYRPVASTGEGHRAVQLYRLLPPAYGAAGGARTR